MTSQARGNTPPDEPCVIFNINETEVDPETFQLPFPPKLSLKRQVSESFLQTRGYIKEQRRIHGSGRGTAIDFPCLPPTAYNIAMTGPSSNFHSAYSTLPTTPPTPENETHLRRPSQVPEIIEKVNAKLRRLFGSRRGSVEDEHTSLNATVSERPSVFHTLSGPPYNSHIQRYPGDFVGMSVASLPNVSEHIHVNGEVVLAASTPLLTDTPFRQRSRRDEEAPCRRSRTPTYTTVEMANWSSFIASNRIVHKVRDMEDESEKTLSSASAIC